MEASGVTKITYSYVRESNTGAMDVGTGEFTAPLAGTYQFTIQAYKVSHFLLLTHKLTILLFTYTCMFIMMYVVIYVKEYVFDKLKYLGGHVFELSLRQDFELV